MMTAWLAFAAILTLIEYQRQKAAVEKAKKLQIHIMETTKGLTAPLELAPVLKENADKLVFGGPYGDTKGSGSKTKNIQLKAHTLTGQNKINSFIAF